MNWLNGKKTYLAAGGLALLGAVLVVKGQGAAGMQAVLIAAGMVGLGDRANRHQGAILAAIQDAARIGADLGTRNLSALGRDASAEAEDIASMRARRVPSSADLDLMVQEAKAKAVTSRGTR